MPKLSFSSKLITLTLILFSAVPGFAASGKGRSLLFPQPNGGQFDLGLNYIIADSKITFKTLGVIDTETSTKGSLIGVSLDLGLNDMFAFGVSANTGTIEETTTQLGTSSSTKDTGMSDPNVYVKINADRGSLFLRGSVGMGISSGNKTNGTTTKDGNRTLGGISVPVQLGAGVNVGAASTIGVRADYTMFMERKIEATSGTTTTQTGGNTTALAAFGEFNFGAGAVGVSAGTYSVAKAKQKTAAGVESEDKGMSGTVVSADLGVYPTANFAILANYTLIMIKDFEYSTFDKTDFNQAFANIGIRLTF